MLQWDLTENDLSRGVLDQEVRRMGKDLDCSFDEVALLTHGDDHWHDAKKLLRKEEWENFNNAQDTVHTEPFGLSYRVRYAFFRHPEVRWRVELMQAHNGGMRGYSPLHVALATQYDFERGHSESMLPVVHLSYKVLTEGDFEREEERLTMRNYLHGQSCRSTYGRFSYWRQGITGLYVKPRVNLRDAK